MAAAPKRKRDGFGVQKRGDTVTGPWVTDLEPQKKGGTGARSCVELDPSFGFLKLDI